MAKRGERRPWKVEYEWSNGIKGRDAYSSRDLAELHAEMIRDAGERRADADVTVRVFNESDPAATVPEPEK